MKVLLILLLLVGSVEAVEMYGYIKDSEGRIVDRVILNKRQINLKEGYTFHEVANKEAVEQIEIYKEPEPIYYNEQKTKRELFQSFQGQLRDLQPYYTFIADMLRFGNDSAFQTLKAYIADLETKQLISTGTVNQFKRVLKNNGVDLDAI